MADPASSSPPSGPPPAVVPLLSVVVPLYNEQDSVDALVAALRAALGGVTERWEILLVDDHSADDTATRIRCLAAEDPRIRGVRLARRQGQHMALACGLDLALGEAVVTMDADLQHPPDRIPEMVQAWQAGYQVVDMVKAHCGRRGFASGPEALAASLFYGVYNFICSTKVVSGTSEFRLLDRRCVEALRQWPERYDYPKGLISRLEARRVQLEFPCPPRQHGRSGYTFGRRLSVAIQALALFASRRLTWLLAVTLLLLLGATASALLFGVSRGGGGAATGVAIALLTGLAVTSSVLLVAVGVLWAKTRQRRRRRQARPPYRIEAVLGGLGTREPSARLGALAPGPPLPSATVMRP